ncbi:metal-dependent hydrolase [Candidatus Falkowbacteria bacterium CG23_combo_of_CG06-09_8_20_14_all_49_15]|uniref:Metal-dependent hydrolase n=1 Tax=Candidatus Falkowbacteria bacterium CG23_combo_of_CG06-09_8_20_14_all_49_15 TaxID=1974572 RepID=A0A2G9ZL32_9BACT|nr:MAG: metal-dependent hydrolase [Candidatus Falkowbacteria bacterium CG23_combo_of_CG06-09_8_20_14_all_49_15]
MNIESYKIQLGQLPVLVRRRPIKNLHLAILPPDGLIRVSAPVHMSDEAIRMLLAMRIPWINKQRAKFQGQTRQAPRKYVSGESHYFWGQRYILEVVNDNKPMSVSLKGKKKIILQVPAKSTIKKRDEVMSEWYREELRQEADKLIKKWEPKIGVTVRQFGIKKMKTRWGTCNHKAGRVWLNLELAKKPVDFTEYVVVHELLHLIEKNHSERFVKLLSNYLPKWRSLKAELNRFILSHEEWRNI